MATKTKPERRTIRVLEVVYLVLDGSKRGARRERFEPGLHHIARATFAKARSDPSWLPPDATRGLVELVSVFEDTGSKRPWRSTPYQLDAEHVTR